MNYATTCNTGSCGGTRVSPCRTPVHHKKSCKESHIEETGEETGQVWTEAGFIPPPECRQAVALLHRLAMEDEPTASLFSPILTVTAKSGEDGHGYRVLDPERLRGMAEDYGIEHGGRSDGEVAHAVTMAIIAEYGAGIPEEYA